MTDLVIKVLLFAEMRNSDMAMKLTGTIKRAEVMYELSMEGDKGKPHCICSPDGLARSRALISGWARTISFWNDIITEK